MKHLLPLVLILVSSAIAAQGPVPLPSEEELGEQPTVDMEALVPTLEEQVAEDLFEDAAKARRTARLIAALGNALDEVLLVVDRGAFQLAGAFGPIGDAAALFFEQHADRLEDQGGRVLRGMPIPGGGLLP